MDFEAESWNEKNEHSEIPSKTNEYPVRNSGWKRILSFCNDSLFGDMLVFEGVIPKNVDLFFDWKEPIHIPRILLYWSMIILTW